MRAGPRIDGAPGRRLQLPHELAQLRHAAATHFQRAVAVLEDGFDAAVGGAAQFAEFFAGHQAVAVDADEAFAELGLQRLERFLDEVLALGVVDHDVFFLGVQVAHVIDRDQPQAAAFERYLKSGSGHAFANKRLWKT